VKIRGTMTDCSGGTPSRKPLDYALALATKQARKLNKNEVCCKQHTSHTIDVLSAKRKPYGWDRRSRAGTKRYRQQWG
jgi:hypothetical protein